MHPSPAMKGLILPRKASSHQRLCNVASLCDVFAVFFVCHADPLFCYHLLRVLFFMKNYVFRFVLMQ